MRYVVDGYHLPKNYFMYVFCSSLVAYLNTNVCPLSKLNKRFDGSICLDSWIACMLQLKYCYQRSEKNHKRRYLFPYFLLVKYAEDVCFQSKVGVISLFEATVQAILYKIISIFSWNCSCILWLFCSYLVLYPWRAGLVQAVESYRQWPEGSGFESQSPRIA